MELTERQIRIYALLPKDQITYELDWLCAFYRKRNFKEVPLENRDRFFGDVVQLAIEGFVVRSVSAEGNQYERTDKK